jgi:hypothetical protein
MMATEDEGIILFFAFGPCTGPFLQFVLVEGLVLYHMGGVRRIHNSQTEILGALVLAYRKYYIYPLYVVLPPWITESDIQAACEHAALMY